MQAQRFPARWSLSVWIITLAVVVFTLFIMGGMIHAATQNSHARETWLLVVGALALPTVLCVAVFFAPLGYAVMPQGILIRRMGRGLAIGFEQISEIRRVAPKEVGFVVRVFGSGGFFGWFGRFYGSRVGWFTAYATDARNLVLITLAGGTRIMISPGPAAVFIQSVDEARQAST